MYTGFKQFAYKQEDDRLSAEKGAIESHNKEKGGKHSDGSFACDVNGSYRTTDERTEKAESDDRPELVRKGEIIDRNRRIETDDVEVLGLTEGVANERGNSASSSPNS